MRWSILFAGLCGSCERTGKGPIPATPESGHGLHGPSAPCVPLPGGMPPAGRRGAVDDSTRLTGMQPEPPQGTGVDMDRDPRPPVPVGPRRAHTIPTDLARPERRPVDAALTQSGASGGQGVEAPLVDFVRGDSDPCGTGSGRGGHADDDARPRLRRAPRYRRPAGLASGRCRSSSCQARAAAGGGGTPCRFRTRR
jgi:hypothetical protein